MNKFLRNYLGVLLVCVGVAGLVAMYVFGRTNSNVANVVALLVIVVGIILHVLINRRGSRY